MIDKIGTNSFQPRTELVTTTEAQPVTSNARKFTVLTVLETVWSETHVKPGPHIMVWIVPIKCVQAIRTIIWNAPKKIRDAIVRIASISIRAIGTDRELFQAIKWKPLSCERDDRDDPKWSQKTAVYHNACVSIEFQNGVKRRVFTEISTIAFLWKR